VKDLSESQIPDIDQRKFLIEQFVQDWLHIRHLEGLLWRLFSYFVTIITATLSIVGLIISGRLTTPEPFIPPLSLAFAGLIFLWSFFILRIFMKWRREFVLHFHDLNRIRNEAYIIRDSRFSIFASEVVEVPPLMKLGSVFMNACYAVISTSALVATAFVWLAEMQSFSFLIGIYTGLFLLEGLLSDGYLIFREEQHSKMVQRQMIRQFNNNINEDRMARRWTLYAILVFEFLWLGVVVTAFISSIFSLIVAILLFLCFAGKVLFFGQRMWAFRKWIWSLLLN
jgi:hypothetical protein